MKGWPIAVLTFIFLGWFLLSVKNNKSSIKLTLFIGLFFEKFKKLPATKIDPPKYTPSLSTEK